MNIFAAIILLLLAAVGGILRKTYYQLPAQELKRRALKREQPAMTLQKAVAFGSSLRIFLWLYIGLATAGGFILLARNLPAWLSVVLIGLLLWLLFARLPKTRVSGLDRKLTKAATPLIIWLLHYLQPVFKKAPTTKRRPDHTGLFERDDLLELIEQQLKQDDSRLSREELEIVRRAIGFSERTVKSIMVPRGKIKALQPTDTIGPILIDELHQSGQAYAVVREKAKSPILGTLDFNQLNLKSTGQVQNAMDDTVYYLHERDDLSQALRAFFVTNHAVFIVVNGAAEYVGLISVKDILEELLGHVPGDDFEQYADIEIVAARHDPSKTSVTTNE